MDRPVRGRTTGANLIMPSGTGWLQLILSPVMLINIVTGGQNTIDFGKYARQRRAIFVMAPCNFWN